MKNTGILLIISFLFFLSGCNKFPWIKEGECDYCYSEKPGTVAVRLNFSRQYDDESEIYYTVYQGKAFGSAIVLEGKTSYSYLDIYMEPDKSYTIVAEYFKFNKTYYVINECTTKIKYLRSVCDDPCYYVFDTQCDLELKIL
ncbi:MAG: hypothetical protein LBQ22_11050 [Bacteroidales bacterium]|jgi:hypothetical protein|nr:hypothetical protein [Bacteroidales bacterium]